MALLTPQCRTSLYEMPRSIDVYQRTYLRLAYGSSGDWLPDACPNRQSFTSQYEIHKAEVANGNIHSRFHSQTFVKS